MVFNSYICLMKKILPKVKKDFSTEIEYTVYLNHPVLVLKRLYLSKRTLPCPFCGYKASFFHQETYGRKKYFTLGVKCANPSWIKGVTLPMSGMTASCLAKVIEDFVLYADNYESINPEHKKMIQELLVKRWNNRVK